MKLYLPYLAFISTLGAILVIVGPIVYNVLDNQTAAIVAGWFKFSFMFLILVITVYSFITVFWFYMLFHAAKEKQIQRFILLVCFSIFYSPIYYYLFYKKAELNKE